MVAQNESKSTLMLTAKGRQFPKRIKTAAPKDYIEDPPLDDDRWVGH
jgi:hypothetical protein